MLDRKVAFDVGFMNYFFLALDWWLVLWQLVVISPSWLVCFCALHLKLQCVSVELPLLLLPCQFLGFVCKEGGTCRSVLANNLTGFLVSIYVDILSFSFSPFLSFPLSRSPLVGCWCVGSWVMVMKAMTAWSSPRTAWLSSLMLFVTFPPGTPCSLVLIFLCVPSLAFPLPCPPSDGCLEPSPKTRRWTASHPGHLLLLYAAALVSASAYFASKDWGNMRRRAEALGHFLLHCPLQEHSHGDVKSHLHRPTDDRQYFASMPVG